jgi:hypothetical protein
MACIAPVSAPDSRPILFRFAPRSESEQNSQNPRHDWVSEESEQFRFYPSPGSDSTWRIGTVIQAPSKAFALCSPRQKAKRAKGLPPARYFCLPRSKPLIRVTAVRQPSCTFAQKLGSPDQKCCIAPDSPNPRKPAPLLGSSRQARTLPMLQMISPPTRPS